MEKLKATLEMSGFSGTALETILDAFELKTFNKHDYFVECGKVSRHLGFIEDGLMQYYVVKDGDERTTYVSVTGTFVSSLLSFISETPSLESVRALAESRVCLITKENLKKLVAEMPDFKNFYIALLEWAVCGIDASRHDLIVLTGEQRYEKMLRTEPKLLQQIPLQYLASMLGVTPRHLSRIRNNIR